jgi:low temperature requirement protein LtrA
VAVTLGGPALFLAGHALYKWAMFGVVSLPRLMAIAALAAVSPVGTSVSPLVLGAIATVVVILVAVLDVVQHRGREPVPVPVASERAPS